MEVLENWKKIQLKIQSSCEKVGRPIDGVRVLPVTKKKCSRIIRTCYGLGFHEVGENYLQEIELKRKELKDLSKLQFHYIGKVQRKKIRKLVEQFSVIQSVDSLESLEKIQLVASELGQIQDIFFEISLAGEAQKGGLAPEALFQMSSSLRTLKNIRCCGLMLMPPRVDNGEENRPLFLEAQKLFKEFRNQLEPVLSANFLHLSMGTSQDFEVAIECGSTFIRLGEILLGSREKK